MKNYTVTMRYQFPAWDEKGGLQWDVRAESKADAIRKARWIARTDGHLCGGKGRSTFSAKESKT